MLLLFLRGITLCLNGGSTYRHHFQLAANFCAVILRHLYIEYTTVLFLAMLIDSIFLVPCIIYLGICFNSITDRFLVVSHNILGDDNAFKHRDLYPSTPSSLLKWNRRLRLICEELRLWQPDIVCLQVPW